MIDIYPTLFVLGAFAAILADRDDVRSRMAVVVAEGRVARHAVRAAARRALVALRRRAAASGSSLASKWSGLYYIVFLGALIIGFDVAARRAAGRRRGRGSGRSSATSPRSCGRASCSRS